MYTSRRTLASTPGGCRKLVQMKPTTDQVTDAIEAVAERLHRPGLTVDVSSTTTDDAAVLTIRLDVDEDYVLANAPEFVANMAEAEAEIAAQYR